MRHRLVEAQQRSPKGTANPDTEGSSAEGIDDNQGDHGHQNLRLNCHLQES